VASAVSRGTVAMPGPGPTVALKVDGNEKNKVGGNEDSSRSLVWHYADRGLFAI
jgi:hypothetical protein